MSLQEIVRQTSQELAALLGSSVESIHRWKVSVPVGGLTPDAVVAAKDSVGALRGWWPRGEMPGQFRNTKPWKRKEELAETRRMLAVKIGVHVNTLRVLWRRREIPPLPPDGSLSRDYIAAIESHPIIRACTLTKTKQDLSTRVGETVPTLHHLWRQGTIPELPRDGKLTAEYVATLRSRVKQWRAGMREQKKLAAEREMKAAKRNREATQKRELLNALGVAGVKVSSTSIRRWLRKGQIRSLPNDGSLPPEYVQSVVDFAKAAKERHRENTRRAQDRPGVQRRKSRSQKLAARRPGEKARKSAATKEMWAKRKAKLNVFSKIEAGRPATRAAIFANAYRLHSQGGLSWNIIAKRLIPEEHRADPKAAAARLRNGYRYYTNTKSKKGADERENTKRRS